MLAIDAHQHFWKYNSVRDAWINEDMKILQRDFMPEDLHPLLKTQALDGCVVVQSDQSETENEFQLANANQYSFIKGVVGWIDLTANDVEERLEHYSHHPKMKGFRHILQGEPQRNFMLRPDFMRGIGLLKQYNFTYDILIFPDQLKYAIEFVANFPDQLFVIDHLAKPPIKEKKIETWRKDVEAIAKYENVFCKISGMVTEADWNHWRQKDFIPYLDAVVKAFGIKRIMFGSDWPVCLLSGSYERVADMLRSYVASWSEDERALLFGGNAVKFYGLL